MKWYQKLWKVIRKPVIVVAWILGALIAFILVGGLGPTVKYVGVPVARAFGLPLTIERCVILPLGGYVCIEGLQVDNPKAFVEAKPDVYGEVPLAKIGKLELDVGMRTIFFKELCIDSVQLTGLRVLYAFDLDTNNVAALLTQMGVNQEEAEEATEEAQEEVEEASEEEVEKKTKVVRLAYVHFEDNSVSIRKFMTIPIPLPPMTLHNVDNRTLQERIKGVFVPVQKAIDVSEKGIGAGIDKMEDGVKNLGDGIKDLFD